MPVILTKKSDTPSAVPTTANLTNAAGGAELAINTADKRLFSINSSSAIIEVGTNPSSLTCADASFTVARIGSLTITSLSLTNATVTSATVTTLTGTSANITNISGTSLTVSTATLSGGTANGVLYLNGSKVATSGSAFTFSSSASQVGAEIYQNANLQSFLRIANDSTGAAGDARLYFQNSINTIEFGLPSTGFTTSGLKVANTAYLYFDGANGFNIGATNGSGLLKFYTGGTTERMRLDSSGNLGLGVTPSAWGSGRRVLQIGAAPYIMGNGTSLEFLANAYYNGTNWIYNSNGAAAEFALNAGAFYWYSASSGTAGNTATLTNTMVLDASGNLGVGATSPSTTLTVSGGNTSSRGQVSVIGSSTDARQTFYNSTTFCGSISFGTTLGYINAVANVPLAFYTNDTERARITSGGYFKASNNGTYLSSTATYHEFDSTTDNSSTLILRHTGTNGTQYGAYITTANDQNDATRFFLQCVGNATERATIRSNGGLANYSANDVNLASDERLKKDISPLNTAWGKVKNIEVVNYRYKDCNENDPLLYGVIAQQVQPIVPELVVVTREATETDPEYYGIREQPMYWLAIKALQEAMARIEQLEAKVAVLENK